MYIYQRPGWPGFKWSDSKIITLLVKVRNLQGQIEGKMETLGFDLKNQANLEVITQDVLKTTEIEGEKLDVEQVRSSVARRLNLNLNGEVESSRSVDGVVEMTVDAINNFNQPMSKERLFGWHCSLFPGGYSSMNKIKVGHWRDDSSGNMQVVSGVLGKDEIYFQAPDAKILDEEMNFFLKWLQNEKEIDLIIKAALAHLWFITIHPFEDGNGRIARAITDMILTQSASGIFRFYSVSSQIRKERKQYYEILEQTQKGTLDVTEWLLWFLTCFLNALESSEFILKDVVFKHNFWNNYALKLDNDRQRKVINKLLDGFDGKLTTSKWAKIAKCSQDTALRDIQSLVDKQVLYKLPKGGRSTAYDIKMSSK
jgi:Fic family protein